MFDYKNICNKIVVISRKCLKIRVGSSTIFKISEKSMKDYKCETTETQGVSFKLQFV